MFHTPVLIKEVIEYLNVKPNGVYIDATVGTGGHAEEILKRLNSGKLMGIDWDENSLAVAKKRLQKYKEKLILLCGSFKNLSTIIPKIKPVNGILFDLGLSSYQLSIPERGFSFQKNGPLDMRYSTKTKLKAYDIINSFTYDKILDILRNYGQVKEAKKITRKILMEREKKKIKTTLQLAKIISSLIKRNKIHPATKVFQALRIYVNDEIENLREGLKEADKILAPNGRLVVISYHSLEDRVVKQFFRDGNYLILTKKPISAGKEEVRLNPRSRSAKLRAGEKLNV